MLNAFFQNGRADISLMIGTRLLHRLFVSRWKKHVTSNQLLADVQDVEYDFDVNENMLLASRKRLST